MPLEASHSCYRLALGRQVATIEGMSSSNRRRYVLAAAVAIAAALGLQAATSAADKSFTVAMEENERQAWEKSLSKIFAEPFAKLQCKAGQRNDLAVGKGCVNAGDTAICCESWTIVIECSANSEWQQKAIDGSSCTSKKIPDGE